MAWLFIITSANAGMAAWFFGNMAQSSLSSTGAFEVFYDGSLVRVRQKGLFVQV